ncbi:MAG: 4-phosphopantetheinyl transferase, partial [Cryptosporangiaceae bacterium]|nr:4-phosphopantetheinyl transferase [Cryptosporangiaceae bacterium]
MRSAPALAGGAIVRAGRFSFAEGWAEVWIASRPALPRDPASVLTEAELRRYERVRDPAAAREFLGGRTMMRSVLSRHLRPECAVTEPGRRGRPQLVRAAGWDVNLSHSAGLIAVAVGHGVRVGVDVQSVGPLPAADALARRYFSAPDRTWIDRHLPDARSQAWHQVWARREAHAKATGAGFSGIAREPRPSDGYHHRPLPVPPGYAGSLVVLAS